MKESVEETAEGMTAGSEDAGALAKVGKTRFAAEEKVVNLLAGEAYQIPLGITSGEPEGIAWKSSDPEVVTVDTDGVLWASGEGAAVVTAWSQYDWAQICVNVYGTLGTGGSYVLDMLTAPGVTRSYHNYRQGAYDYDSYDEFIAWHGCGVCTATAVLTAYAPAYADIKPNEVIGQLESAVDPDAFEKNYSKSMKDQRPLNLNGITRLYEQLGIPVEYVCSFDRDTVAEDIRAHLRTGNPVIYQKGNGGYHVMAILGLLADGDLLVSDPAGEQRVRVTTMDHVTDQMFSSKKEPDGMYFHGRATAGGYIKAGTAKPETP